jgi:hypothetical protein
MRTLVNAIFPSILFAMLVFASPASAYWAADGVAVSAAFQNQVTPQLVSDGSGGAIIVWRDERDGNEDIYAQRVNAAGVPLWAADGVPICTDPNYQRDPVIVSDGAGGAIIAWQDDRGGTNDIYAQRVNASGTALWMADGQVISSAAGEQTLPHIVSDAAGGAIIAWIDGRSMVESDIYAQRVNAAGVDLWTWDGVAVCTASNNQFDPELIPDGAGGAIVVWDDFRSLSSFDIYAQRVNSWGVPQWTANGVALCVRSADQIIPAIASDGSGGAIVAWQDARAAYYDIYAQRVNSSGAVQWTANGVALCNASFDQSAPEMIPDGAGGAIVTWVDARGGIAYDIYAQRMSSAGAAQWTANGVAICAFSSDQYQARIVAGAAGGAIIAWEDTRSGGLDVYAQGVSASGAVQWAANGIPLSAAVGDQWQVRLVSDGGGGAIAAWRDVRTGREDIYCQSVDRSGRAGYLAPDIYSARDIPGDQGGSVYLSWYAARADFFRTADVSYYSIWRAIDPVAASIALVEGVQRIETLADLDPSKEQPVVRVERIGSVDYFWELLDSQGAYFRTSYGKPVATLFDSTAVCDEYHYFQVVAHSSDPFVFWESAIDSGRSVDNLAPAPPVGLAGEQRYTPQGLELTWNANDEIDLGGYAIYRGTSADFVPGPGTLVTSTADTLYLDGSWSWDGGYYYKVAAVDVHGNESAYAVLGPDGVTGDETPRTPAATRLAQNFPNPFNPTTRIEFDLAAPGLVRLRIYDAAGRLVRSLVDESMPAGRYVRLWDGRDARGSAVASGIYFYRLDAGAYTQTRKMVLLR